jgi:hypothetical protein
MRTRFLCPTLALYCAILIAVVSAPAQVPAKGKLWTAVSVPEPLITSGRTFMLSFGMVNDGNKPVDPKVSSWRLNINGKDHPDSAFTFANGPRDARWKSLPAGDRLQFAYAMGDWFKERGIYRVVWRGEGFESSPVVFRVVSEMKKQRTNGPSQ